MSNVDDIYMYTTSRVAEYLLGRLAAHNHPPPLTIPKERASVDFPERRW